MQKGAIAFCNPSFYVLFLMLPTTIVDAIPLLARGKRYTVPRPTGSADALLIAQHVRKQAARITLVIAADATDAHRLADEIVWFDEEIEVTQLPDWETLPYETFSPHQDLISERLATLWALHQAQGIQRDKPLIVIVPATTALFRLSPPEFLAAYTFTFKQGEKLNEATLKAQLSLAGYEHVSQVARAGEYAVRGGLIDLYPMGSLVPYRVDLFGDEIDSIRTFDPDTQRSLYPVKDVRLLPGREFPLDDKARQRFRSRYREALEGDPTKSAIYKDVSNGIASAGIEYYLPLFFERTATLFDYVGDDAQVLLHGPVQPAIATFLKDTNERYRLLRHDPERPLLAPELLMLTEEQFFASCNAQAQLVMRAVTDEASAARALPELAINRNADDACAKLRALVAQGAKVLLCAESAGRVETLNEFLREHALEAPRTAELQTYLTGKEAYALTAAPLANGFLLGDIHFITETELFALTPTQRRRKRQEQTTSIDALIKDLAELNIGDPVVHTQHGIGRYAGLMHMDLGDGNTEFLHLTYANEASLYVPVPQMHLISRYTGVGSSEAPLHSLGSGQWEKAKKKAAEQVYDTAAELLNLYARRSTRVGHPFKFSAQDYEKFAASFGFEETADQRAAIHAVIQDMVSGKPMDRLVCGDVGFGKTEVALRAAFVAVTGGKQVAVLAPTTLLAEQHCDTFKSRFADWPVKIAEMSRFRSQKEITTALKGLQDGTVDIVIGTHKIFSSDTKFSNLGLVVIDEEHRFGVRHKEALKALRSEVDVLTLTATPIPRTLGMALEGLRELSIIATAPQKRLAIKTFVRNESPATIREAVLRELKRGGQVYYLHNEVDTIAARKEKLQELVPEARIAVAHGQMPERELERVMKDFVAQRYNLLLCTTIIETGIDVPSANTIVIHRADKFGLAQLHQLRGRVGRSHHQAYAYLMVNDKESLTKHAMQRLEAIQQMEELGSGFYLAMHDLEIRGAGEVLGENQSGDMHEVGFQLYNDMLKEAVASLKAGREPDLLNPLSATTEINLHSPALLPEDYCGDVHTRLSLYKRMASAETATQLDAINEELVDRFGRLPDPAQALMDVHRLRITAKPYGVQKIDAGPKLCLINFKPHAPIDAIQIISLIQKHRHIKLNGQDKLRIEKETENAKERAALVREVLRQLGAPKTQEKIAA
jgi:transcription-repair coupling factor (superfamily II helicase)